jgi:hypothetical protein
MKEVWRKIKGHKNYEVSNLGMVRHHDKSVMAYPEILIFHNLGGYLGVNMLGKHMYVHRIVAQAFVKNPLNKKEVNHKDINKFNNRSDNLEWVTRQENIDHFMYSPRGRSRLGEKHHSSKLTEKDVKFIRKSKLHPTVISKRFNILREYVYVIRNRKVWKHI